MELQVCISSSQLMDNLQVVHFSKKYVLGPSRAISNSIAKPFLCIFVQAAEAHAIENVQIL